MAERKKRKRRKKVADVVEETPALDPFHVRYRPQNLKDVVGQASAVNAIDQLLKGKSRPHSYLFTGPSGVGKTTLARIIGRRCKVEAYNVMEIDAATNSGVDAMRAIKQAAETRGFGSSEKLVIVDECHSLSKQAWQSWLKIVEEPPSHLYLVFCTTESTKVPRTIKTRCQHFDLKSVGTKDLAMYLDEICFAEQITGLNSNTIRALAAKAEGSPRQALVYLQAVAHCKSKDEAMDVIDSLDETNDEAFDIVRAIVNGESFMKVKAKIAKLEDGNYEGVRIITMNYAAKALLGTKSKDKAGWLLEVMDEFSEPWNPNEKKAPLLLAAGRLLL